MKRFFDWKIILTVILLLCNVYVIFGNISSTNPIVGWYNSEIEPSDDFSYEIVIKNGETYEGKPTITDGAISCYIPVEFYDIDTIKISGDDIEKLKDSELIISSRDMVIYREKSDYNVKDGKMFLSSDEADKIHFLLGFDWRLKIEILAFVWAGYILAMVIDILHKKNKLNAKAIGTIIITIVLCYFLNIISGIEKTYTSTENNIKNAEVSDMITKDSSFVQQFKSDKNIMGVRVRFATYGTKIYGQYILTLFNNDMQELEEVYFDGNTLSDNGYCTVFLEDTHSKGTYYFSIRDADSKNESLAIWYSAKNEYADGTLSVNGNEIEKDMDFNLLVDGPNTKLIAIVISVSLYFLILMIMWKDKSKVLSKISIEIIYVFAIIYTVFMLIFVWKYLSLGAYDEMAHISYMADMVKNPSFVPDYAKQYLLVSSNSGISDTYANTMALTQSFGTFVGKWTNTVSYLGHPPLYYWIMTPLNAVHFNNELVMVNLDRLRMFNVALTTLGIALFLYIGYTRIDKRYISLHFLYASMIVAFPMITGIGPTVNNDNLAVLIVAVFMLGIIRFAEKKRNKLTYFLIAIGITASALTKLTMCLMLVVCALFFVIKTIITEKNWKESFNKNFWWSVPIYLTAAIFYSCLFIKYGKIQISLTHLVSTDVFRTYDIVYKAPMLRTRMTFADFINKFKINFLNQWSAGVTWNKGADGYFALNRLPFKLLWLSPFVALIRTKYKKSESDMRNFMKGFSFALIFTVIMQFIRAFKDFQFNSGHPGLQSRYYICVMPIMIFIICYELQSRMSDNIFITTGQKTSKKMYINTAFSVFAIALGALAVYGGGLYYFFNTVSFCKKFYIRLAFF